MVAKVLARPTLVLNRNWQPVNVATIGRALTILWKESARVVAPHDFRLYDWADWSQLWPVEGELFIQAVRLQLRVPEVITLKPRSLRTAISAFRFHLIGSPQVLVLTTTDESHAESPCWCVADSTWRPTSLRLARPPATIHRLALMGVVMRRVGNARIN